MHDLDDLNEAKEIAGMAYDAAASGYIETAKRLWGEVEGLLGTTHTSEAQPEDDNAPSPEKPFEEVRVTRWANGEVSITRDYGQTGESTTVSGPAEAIFMVADIVRGW